MAPFISVIIPAYNEENFIRPTLHHLQHQTFQNFETIVVANGCTDSTESIVKRRLHPNLKLITLPHPHVSRARNEGARHACGQLLLFLDADTHLSSDALQKISDLARPITPPHNPSAITKKPLSSHHITTPSPASPQPPSHNPSFPNPQPTSFIYGTTQTSGDSPELKFRLLLSFKNLYLKYGFHQGSSGAFFCSRDLFTLNSGFHEALITGEHHELISRLKQHGKYRFAPTLATTSLRRYRRWGIRKITLFWIKRYLKGSRFKNSYEHIR